MSSFQSSEDGVDADGKGEARNMRGSYLNLKPRGSQKSLRNSEICSKYSLVAPSGHLHQLQSSDLQSGENSGEIATLLCTRA